MLFNDGVNYDPVNPMKQHTPFVRASAMISATKELPSWNKEEGIAGMVHSGCETTRDVCRMTPKGPVYLGGLWATFQLPAKGEPIGRQYCGYFDLLFIWVVSEPRINCEQLRYHVPFLQCSE